MLDPCNMEACCLLGIGLLQKCRPEFSMPTGVDEEGSATGPHGQAVVDDDLLPGTKLPETKAEAPCVPLSTKGLTLRDRPHCQPWLCHHGGQGRDHPTITCTQWKSKKWGAVVTGLRNLIILTLIMDNDAELWFVFLIRRIPLLCSLGKSPNYPRGIKGVEKSWLDSRSMHFLKKECEQLCIFMLKQISWSSNFHLIGQTILYSNAFHCYPNSF